jgi:hypothetical protein
VTAAWCVRDDSSAERAETGLSPRPPSGPAPARRDCRGTRRPRTPAFCVPAFPQCSAAPQLPRGLQRFRFRVQLYPPAAQGDMDPAPAAAAAEVAIPTWTNIEQLRDYQAVNYIKGWQRHAAAHPIAVPPGAEPRIAKLKALLAKAFPASTGMPDPAGWKVTFKKSSDKGKGSGNVFSHPGFCGGIKLYSLPQLAKRAVKIMAEAQEQAPTPVAAAGPAVLPTGSGVLAQMEQLLAPDGVLADFAAKHRRATTVDARGEEDQGADAAPAADEDAATALQAAVKVRLRSTRARTAALTRSASALFPAHAQRAGGERAQHGAGWPHLQRQERAAEHGDDADGGG